METIVLIDEMYLPFLFDCVDAAKDSIYAIIYYAHISKSRDKDNIKTLFNMIALKKNAGLDVKILLNYVATKNYLHDGLKRSFEYLQEKNVPVKCADASRVTHTKMFVIDRQHLIIGSHNLSKSSIMYNREMSIYNNHPGEAAKVCKYFLDEFYKADDKWLK